MTLELETLLPWSAPATVETKAGTRILRKAKPTESFWSLWRSNKETLKAAGISCSQYNGNWEVCFWSKPSAEEVAKKAEAIEASRATDAAVEIPKPDDCEFLGYQKAGICFALKIFGVDLSKLTPDNGSRKDNKYANRNLSSNACNDGENQISASLGESATSENQGDGIAPKTGSDRSLDSKSIAINTPGYAPTRNQEEASGGGSQKPGEEWSELPRWERPADDSNSQTGGGDSGTTGIRPGDGNSDSGSSDESQSPPQLQSGFRESKEQSGNRIGRSTTSVAKAETDRSKENRSSSVARLEGASDTTRKGGDANPFRGDVRGVLIADEMG